MKTRIEEDLKLKDMEVLIEDKFLIDSFKPKLCHEKDVLVFAFLATHHHAADELGRIIERCPVSVMNIEVSASPDPQGNFTVVGEINRDPSAFEGIEAILEALNLRTNVARWYFKTAASANFMPWNMENFNREVPQKPAEFLSREEDNSLAEQPDADDAAGDNTEPTAEKVPPTEPPTLKPEINYQQLAKIIDKQVSRSSRLHAREFKKQIKSMFKDNHRLLKQLAELKSDSKYFFEQLEMYQRREKLALLRERQDIKRIRDLEDRLSYLMIIQSESRRIPLAGNIPLAIPVGDIDASPVGPE